MLAADLAAVVAIAGRVHPDYPERQAVFAERLCLHPQGCLVLQGESRQPCGYAVSHPWHEDRPPKLDTLLGALPAVRSTYHLHDVAIDIAARGLGAGSSVITLLAAHAKASGCATLSLVAVGSAERYWQRQGFACRSALQLAAHLTSYGTAACFMVRPL